MEGLLSTQKRKKVWKLQQCTNQVPSSKWLGWGLRTTSQTQMLVLLLVVFLLLLLLGKMGMASVVRSICGGFYSKEKEDTQKWMGWIEEWFGEMEEPSIVVASFLVGSQKLKFGRMEEEKKKKTTPFYMFLYLNSTINYGVAKIWINNRYNYVNNCHLEQWNTIHLKFSGDNVGHSTNIMCCQMDKLLATMNLDLIYHRHKVSHFIVIEISYFLCDCINKKNQLNLFIYST